MMGGEFVTKKIVTGKQKTPGEELPASTKSVFVTSEECGLLGCDTVQSGKLLPPIFLFPSLTCDDKACILKLPFFIV